MRHSGFFYKTAVALLLAFALSFTYAGEISAEETGSEETEEEQAQEVQTASGETDETVFLKARFLNADIDAMSDLWVPYSDDFFSRDPNVYYQDLAQASLGMAVAACRDRIDEDVAADANIENFFNRAGFTDYESDWYDQDPTEDSIASAIASRQIGSTTVVAFVCCGSGYETEWVSNLKVGSGTDHEGFFEAEAVCEDRLDDYIQEKGITGSVKLWISGYSRAAAVGNALAGRLMAGGQFDSIYAYFYATPNNTREPIAYENIFNIIGQNDPVAQVPLAEWGYGRYGRDLYIPAQEFNSSYTEASAKADGVSQALSGIPFRNNPDLNRQLRVVFEFLTVIWPTAEDYTATLQPKLTALYREYKDVNLLALIREALKSDTDFRFNVQERAAADALIDYLDDTLYQYVSGNEKQVSDGSWLKEVGADNNLIREHMPMTYISWIFSTSNPGELFADSTETLRLVIQGDFDIEVEDEQGMIQTVTCDDGEIIYAPGEGGRAEDADLICLYIDNAYGSAVINIPCDRDYTLQLNVKEKETISLFCDRYSAMDFSNTVSEILLFKAKENDAIILDDLISGIKIGIHRPDGTRILCLHEYLRDDTASIIARERLMRGGYSISDLAYVGLAVFALPILLLIAALAINRISHRRKKGAVTVCLGLIAGTYAIGAARFHIMLHSWYVTLPFLALTAIFAGVCVHRIYAAGRANRQQESA